MNNNTEINVKCEFSFTEEEYDTLVSATETYGITINELFQALAKDITALDRHAMDWYGKSKELFQVSRPFVSYIFREHAADVFVDFPYASVGEESAQFWSELNALYEDFKTEMLEKVGLDQVPSFEDCLSQVSSFCASLQHFTLCNMRHCGEA